MTAAQIKSKIAKLEKGLNSKIVPEQFKQKARKEIASLKKELAKLEKPKKATSKPKTTTKAKPKTTATKPSKPKAKPKTTTSKRRKLTDTQRYIQQVSRRATQIQRAGGKVESGCKTVYKINRADAVKKAAKEIQFDADNKNRPDFMDGLLGGIFGKKGSKKK